MTGPLRLVVATRNPGKLAELRELLATSAVELCSLGDFPGAPEVPEELPSYAENASAKARAIAQYTGLPALADDSGLEVDALGGRPGPRSARFGGEPSNDRRNIEKLLQELQGVPMPQRTARFRCVMVVARADDGPTLEVAGVVEGLVATAPRGAGGFGYDPVFFVPSLGRTFAELAAAEKHRICHRGRACAQLRERLLSFLRAPDQVDLG
jgi:XTP/dITP diphosphohydrolase